MDKTCTICGETKDVGQFKKHAACKSGYVSRCKVCVNRMSMERYRRDHPGAQPQRYVTDEQHKARVSAYNKSYQTEHKADLSKYFKKYSDENPERRKLNHIKYHKRTYYPNKNRAAVLRNKYGLTETQYSEMVARQGGKCAICGDVPVGKNLCVDHDHKTNVVRGLLCNRCNSALGHFRDDPQIVRLALRYIEGAQS